MLDDDKLITLAYINCSSYRVKAVKTLKNTKKIPTDIARDSGIRVNHISKVLKELKECGVAECINEQDRKNRFYKLTPEGEELSEYVK